MTDAVAPAGLTSRAKPLFSEGYKRWVLGLLLVVYTSNFIDRTIIAYLAPALRADLKLTATQIGLLQGLAFAVLYALLGLPIARLAERKSRVSIIAVCLAAWSAFTALCGVAQNFLVLLLFRVGVGVGEAGCSPPAHSLISDYYEPKKRATALSIYSFGIPLGTMIGAVAGGWIAQNLSWRAAFLIVGLPGLVLALIVKLGIKEPPRGHSEAAPVPELPSDATVEPQAAPPSLLQVFKVLFSRWSWIHLALGVMLASFAGYGVGAFVPQYFTSTFGLNLAKVGLVFGLIGGFSAGAGTLLGGFLTDRLGRSDGKWYALVPAIGLLVATPVYLLAYSRDAWTTAALLLLIPGIFHYTYLGPTFAATHNLVEPRMRATATAILFLVLNLIALGAGPVFTGWLADLFSQHAFASQGLGTFQAACPGGKAVAGASAEAAAACRGAVGLGARHAILATTLIYAWAGVHYLLAAVSLGRDLKAAAAKRAA